jgi:1-phosphatidylinositol-3-phosphate 5-kinase
MTPVSQRTADQIRDQLQSPYTEDENEVFNASPVSDKSYSTMILSPLTHQNIVLLFTKFSNETRREEYEIHPEIIVIAYYTENDMSLGRYLEAKCLNDSIRKDVLGITRSYAHDDGKVIVTVEQSAHMVTTEEDGIMMWGVCKECGRHVTPVIPMSTSTYNYSFGKFLETMFYNRQLRCRTGGCSHLLHRDHIRCFAYKDLIAKFEYRSVIVYDIVVPGNVLTYNEQYEQDCFQKLLQTIGEGVTELFNSFFMVISEMNQKLQYRQCHTALGELLELIRTQQESFWSYFHNISSYKDLPKLNDFVRSVYVAGTNWNESLKEAAEFTPTIANRSSTIIPKIFTTGENDTFVRPTTRLQRPQHLPQTPPKHKYISIILSDNNGQIAVHMSEPPVPSLNLSELKHSVQSVSRLSPDVVQDPDYTSSPLSVVSQSDSVFSVTPSRTPVSPNPIVSDTGRNSPRVLVAPSPVVKPSTVTSNGTPQVKIPLQIENVAAHMYMSSGVNNANVIVYDDEPSTIIAYTLSSKDYDETMTTIKTDETMEQQMLSKEPSHFKFSMF